MNRIREKRDGFSDTFLNLDIVGFARFAGTDSSRRKNFESENQAARRTRKSANRRMFCYCTYLLEHRNFYLF